MANAWQAFDTSTEAGRMLKKLYGNAAGHPNIAYPKLTTRPRKTAPKFIPGGAKLGVDARSNSNRRERASAVEPWRKKYERPKYHPIQFVSKKRNTRAIDEILEETRQEILRGVGAILSQSVLDLMKVTDVVFTVFRKIDDRSLDATHGHIGEDALGHHAPLGNDEALSFPHDAPVNEEVVTGLKGHTNLGVTLEQFWIR